MQFTYNLFTLFIVCLSQTIWDSQTYGTHNNRNNKREHLVNNEIGKGFVTCQILDNPPVFASLGRGQQKKAYKDK